MGGDGGGWGEGGEGGRRRRVMALWEDHVNFIGTQANSFNPQAINIDWSLNRNRSPIPMMQ